MRIRKHQSTLWAKHASLRYHYYMFIKMRFKVQKLGQYLFKIYYLWDYQKWGLNCQNIVKKRSRSLIYENNMSKYEKKLCKSWFETIDLDYHLKNIKNRRYSMYDLDSFFFEPQLSGPVSVSWPDRSNAVQKKAVQVVHTISSVSISMITCSFIKVNIWF